METHLQLESSATVVIASRAAEKKVAGERIFNLSAGEPIMPPHPLVAAAANQAIAEGKTLYPPVAGLPELRRAASAWLNSTYHTNYSEKNTIVTCGGKFGIFALCQAYLAPGDEAIIIAPFWVSYAGITKLSGGVPKIIPTSERAGWKARPEDIARAIMPRTKILFLNNASNPTGALYTRSELAHILELAARHNILVISDEVYSGLVYDNAEFVSAGSFSEFQNNVAVIQSCSKHFAMTGWRVGFTFAAPEVITVLTALQSQSTTGTASISQWAAIAAVQNATTIVNQVRTAMHQRRDTFITTFNKLFSTRLAPPLSGLYVFIPLLALGTRETDSVRFCEAALDQGNVAIVPGVAFGCEGYVRFSFGAEESELVVSLEMLKKFVNENFKSPKS